MAYVVVCRDLADWFNEEGHKTSRNFVPLQESVELYLARHTIRVVTERIFYRACDQTLAAFEEAIRVASSLGDANDESEESKKAKQLFEDAKMKFRQCFFDFKVNSSHLHLLKTNRSMSNYVVLFYSVMENGRSTTMISELPLPKTKAV